MGMKWGVRRYRNKDGTLTPAGKKRYRYDYPISRREVRRMSDQELSDRISRLKKEKEYISLAGENIDQGKAYARRIVKDTGHTAVSTFTKTLAATGAAFATKLLFSKLAASKNGTVAAAAKAVSGSGDKKKK